MTDTVLAQILSIRDSGVINMCDCYGVQRIALERNFFDLVQYIEEDPCRYFNFILNPERRRTVFSQNHELERKEQFSMIKFTATHPSPPANMSLRAKLAWHYFFGQLSGNWIVIHTVFGCWITVDESCDLDNAAVYPNDNSFIFWLEEVTNQHLEDNSLEYLRNFCVVPELIDSDIALAMEKLIQE